MPIVKKCLKRIRSVSVVLFFLICSLFIRSQNVYGQKIAADTVLIKEWIKDLKDSIASYPQPSLITAQKIIDLSEKTGYKTGVASGLLAMGVCKMTLGEIPDALENYNKALNYTAENGLRQQQCRAWVNKGTLYAMIGSYDSAIACFMAVGEKLHETNDLLGMAGIYTSIGNCESSAHNFAEADKYYAKAEDILQKLNEPKQNAGLYSNMAANYLNQEKYPEAIKYLKKCLEIFVSLNDSTDLAGPFHNLGLAYSKTNNVDSGLFYLNMALRLSEKTNNLPYQSDALFNIAAIYDNKKKYDEAIVYYNRSLAIDNKIKNWLGIFDAYSALAGIYKEKKDLALAFDYMNKSIPAHDSLINDNKIRTVEELTTKFETKEIEDKNRSLQKENSIQKLRLQRKNILVYSGFSTALLFLVIGIQIVRQNKLKTSKQKLELEQKQLLAQMNPHFIFNCLNSIQHFVINDDKLNANRYLADFALLMRQTLDNSKDGIISLVREIEYLENYLSFEYMRFKDKFAYAIQCAPDINTDTTEIPSMIIQPFVENAIRHGLCNLDTRMGLLNIRFFKKEGFLFCEVDDNGIGIEKAKKIKDQAYIKYQSHGMELTRKRLALVSKMRSDDYKITIINKNGESQGAEGTTIIIQFPLQA